jgi:hypothetical protein
MLGLVWAHPASLQGACLLNLLVLLAAEDCRIWLVKQVKQEVVFSGMQKRAQQPRLAHCSRTLDFRACLFASLLWPAASTC